MADTLPCLLIARPYPQAGERLSLGTSTWREEYRRLKQRIPNTLISEKLQHLGGGTDATFSSDGALLASCGSDARLLVWRLGRVGL